LLRIVGTFMTDYTASPLRNSNLLMNLAQNLKSHRYIFLLTRYGSSLPNFIRKQTLGSVQRKRCHVETIRRHKFLLLPSLIVTASVV
jgi:hypothetical protein